MRDIQHVLGKLKLIENGVDFKVFSFKTKFNLNFPCMFEVPLYISPEQSTLIYVLNTGCPSGYKFCDIEQQKDWGVM